MIRIVLIDDHPLAIRGIGAWLRGIEQEGNSRFAVIGSAGNLADARGLLEYLDPLPDIIILDLSLGKEDGLELIPIIKEICDDKKTPPPGILVCSMYEDPFLVQRAIDAGAQGYVSKSEESGEIISAIEAILAGKIRINEKYKIPSPNMWSSLTRRENEIVTLVRRSMSNPQISEQLGLSIRTVENHLARIYVKLNISSRRELHGL
ncbi:MAG: response regulator transcription factor [Treponema sp.]|nr:response regulator transcription factor [Treponema sp.]